MLGSLPKQYIISGVECDGFEEIVGDLRKKTHGAQQQFAAVTWGQCVT